MFTVTDAVFQSFQTDKPVLIESSSWRSGRLPGPIDYYKKYLIFKTKNSQNNYRISIKCYVTQERQRLSRVRVRSFSNQILVPQGNVTR